MSVTAHDGGIIIYTGNNDYIIILLIYVQGVCHFFFIDLFHVSQVSV